MMMIIIFVMVILFALLLLFLFSLLSSLFVFDMCPIPSKPSNVLNHWKACSFFFFSFFKLHRLSVGGGGGYGLLNGSPEMRYPGGAFGDGYGGVWGPYDKRGPPRR